MTQQSRLPCRRALEQKSGVVDGSQDEQAVQVCSQPLDLLKRNALKTHLGDLTREHGVGLVAVYPEWMKAIAPEWKPLAKLCIAGWQWGPASPRVMFYSTPDTDLPAMQATLARFQATLPPGSTMELNPHDSSMGCKSLIGRSIV